MVRLRPQGGWRAEAIIDFRGADLVLDDTERLATWIGPVYHRPGLFVNKVAKVRSQRDPQLYFPALSHATPTYFVKAIDEVR